MGITDFHAVIALDAFDERHVADVGGWPVLIVRTDAGITALHDRCTHAGSRLSGGRIRRGAIMCPLHGARFDIASGKCLGTTYPTVRSFDVRVTGGMIEIAVPATAPTAADLPIG